MEVKRVRAIAAMTVLALAVAASCGGDDATDETATDEAAATQPTAAVPETTTTGGADDVAEDGAARQPVVIDTDVSVEGAMAILYLLGEPTVAVEAITVSGTGLASCRRGVDQVLGLVALSGADPIPVACGRTAPLVGDNAFPASFRAVADSLGGVLLPVGDEPSELLAEDLLAEVIADADQPVRIYADGPLTNLAVLFDEHPDLGNVAGITLMGGAVDVAGNTVDNPDAEWNIWIDPVAADRVLAAGHPVTVVPLDATNDVPVTPMHVRALEPYAATPVAATVNDLVRSIRGVEEGFVYFWDQLNAAVLLDESLVTLEDRTISVATDGGPSRVGTMTDDPGGYPVRLAVAADREAFERSFFTALMGEPFEPVDLSPDATVTYDGEGWTHDVPAQIPLGPLILAFENSSDVQAFVPVLWLLDDATIEDLEAWGSIDQPPFTGLAGFAFAEPGDSALTVVDITFAGTNIVVGITVEPFSNHILTTFDAG
jgi:pyrimidine-specific ribonucleoside hydrolase